MSAALLLVCGVLASDVTMDVIINELHYAPAERTVPEEFIELFNAGESEVDLSGWRFDRGVGFLFPEGTTLATKSFLVVAQDPALWRARRDGVAVVGPFEGRLANSGERLRLVDAAGNVADELSYRNAFPWPVVDRRTPSSIELIDPRLDNAAGGSWRRASAAGTRSSVSIEAGSHWRYFKGTTEPPGPRAAWRRAGYDDGAWASGPTPIGFGEPHLQTTLPDMRGRYATLYLRREFVVGNPSSASDLVLEVSYDDGFVAWLNGGLVASANVPTTELGHDAVAIDARENLDFDPFEVSEPSERLVAGRNVLAVQLLNASISQSSDAYIDVRLRSRTLAATPGAPSSTYAEDPPPSVERVAHEPERPGARDTVTVLADVARLPEGAEVRLEYQTVDPGAYIALDDAEYATAWRSLRMQPVRDGEHEGRFGAELPASVQRHRRLVRYRIAIESDSDRVAQAPDPSAPEPNFAYFVYDGLPQWRGAIDPSSRTRERSRVVRYDADTLGAVPVYHLIAKQRDVEDATWDSKFTGKEFRWTGTFVYDGEVYDHIGFRARGGQWRYAMGKNMWKVNFHRTHRLRARDNHGRKYATRWDKLNLCSNIQLGTMRGRGEQGMYQSVGYRLFQLAGVAAPHTHFVHLRIIDAADEHGPTQYDGDFWGLYLAVEQMDGRFLEEHGLADGNLYRMEIGRFELESHADGAAADGSDVVSFMAGYRDVSGGEAWWREHFDLEGYYRYRAIVEAIHHYDIGQGKNYFYYRDPATSRWSVLPWDVDLTWSDRMFGDGRDPFVGRVLSRPSFALEYRNHVRDIRDLVFNAEQTGALIDEYAALIEAPRRKPAIVDADRARWDYHPVMSDRARIVPRQTGPGLYYLASPTRDFAGMVRAMKEYVETRGRLLDDMAHDAAIPATPEVTYAGPRGFPSDALTFRVSEFEDPQGADTFAAIEWRLAEVTPAGGRPARDTPRRYEADAVWESGELTALEQETQVPADAVTAGKTYRARARVKDTSGRWSHWSQPVELVVGE